jgi:thiol-disulfide isomerase/thioredoxin
MKKIFTIILIMMLTLTLTGCSDKPVEKTDALKFKEEYEKQNGVKNEKYNVTTRTLNIPEDNPMVYATAEEIVTKIENKETFVVYFGFSDCPWCRSVVEELIHVAKDLNVEKLYYVDVKELRDVKELDEDNNVITSKEGDKHYMELLNKLDSVLDDYTLTDKDGNEISAGEKRIYAPNVVGVANGIPTELETGESEKLTNPYDELTDEMRKETYNKLKCVFKCFEDNTPTCKKNMC